MQIIQMKYQALFSLKNKINITKTRLFKYIEYFTTKKMKIFR